MVDNDEKEVIVSYSKSKDFKHIPATGAYGGPNPQGEIICNFYVEYRKYPQELKITVDGKTGKVKKEFPHQAAPLIRDLQIGVIMRPDIARLIGEWLIKEADKVIFQTAKEAQKV